MTDFSFVRTEVYVNLDNIEFHYVCHCFLYLKAMVRFQKKKNYNMVTDIYCVKFCCKLFFRRMMLPPGERNHYYWQSFENGEEWKHGVIDVVRSVFKFWRDSSYTCGKGVSIQTHVDPYTFYLKCINIFYLKTWRTDPIWLTKIRIVSLVNDRRHLRIVLSLMHWKWEEHAN